MRRLMRIDSRAVVYVIGGALSALTDIGVMQFLLLKGADVYLATSVGFGAGLAVNYAFHAKVTFKRASNLPTFVRYMCVVGINYLLTLGLVAAAVALTDMALIGKILSLPVVAINGYFLSKFWIFK